MLAGPPRCRERREPAALSHSLAAGVCCFQHLKSNQALSREQMRRQKDRASGAMRETGTCAQSPSQVSTELGAGSGRTSGKLSCQTAVHFLAGTGPISSQAQPGFKRPLHASYLKGGQGARGGRCNLWGSDLRRPPAPAQTKAPGLHAWSWPGATHKCFPHRDTQRVRQEPQPAAVLARNSPGPMLPVPSLWAQQAGHGGPQPCSKAPVCLFVSPSSSTGAFGAVVSGNTQALQGVPATIGAVWSWDRSSALRQDSDTWPTGLELPSPSKTS